MRIAQRLASVLLASALALSLAVAASAAQGAKGQHHGTHAISQVWLNRLNLSADQQAKIKSATDGYQVELQKTQSLTGKEKRQATRQARTTYQNTVQAVLNPDQQKQLETMQAEARQYHDMGGVGNRLVGLNLTEEQKSKVKAICDKYQPEIQKLRASQKEATDKRAVRTQRRDLNQKMADEVKAVLTPDQQQQFQPAARQHKRK